MTRVATGNVLHAAEVVLGLEVISQDALVREGSSVEVHWIQTRRLLVTHVEDFCPRPKEFFRRPMAVQAPLHLQGRMRIHHRHAIYGAVAIVAANPFVDMNAMIEEDVIGEIVRPRPVQRNSRAVAFANGPQHFAVGPHLRMTIHAGLGRRHSGEAGLFDRRVTVTAIKAQPSDVVLVAEGERLGVNHAAIGVIRRALHHFEEPEQREHDDHAPEKGKPVERIRVGMKELTHLPGACSCTE